MTASATALDLTTRAAVLVNFGESVNFPLLFAVALSVFGAATLLHLLLVSVASRRVEAGLLKALGFVRRQVAAADQLLGLSAYGTSMTSQSYLGVPRARSVATVRG